MDLRGYLTWPGAHQVFRLDRQITTIATGRMRQEVVYGVTSLAPDRASADCLLHLVRNHWRIENRSHWVRDVTFTEDQSRVHRGAVPRVMATLRNTAIGLIRCTGTTQIAATTRRLAAHPAAAVALLTPSGEN